MNRASRSPHGRRLRPPVLPGASQDVLDATREALVAHADLSSLGPDASLDRAVRLLAGSTRAPLAALSVFGDNRQFLRRHDRAQSEAIGPAEELFCRHTMVQDRTTVITDTRTDPRTERNALNGPWGFYAGVPVHAPSGVALGALCILDVEPRTPTPHELATLSDLRDAVEESLYLRFMALTDPLTGLYSRHGLDEVAGTAWDAQWRDTRPVATIAVAVDRFRNYRDVRGLAAGNQLLRDVGAVLEDAVASRPGALTARLGGDDFGVLCPNLDRFGAERLCLDIQARVVTLGATSPATRAAVTVSLGCAVLPPTCRWPTLGDALAAADGARARAQAERGARVRFCRFH